MSIIHSWLLNLAYVAVLVVCSPWIVWTAVRKGKYREGFAARLLGNVPLREGDRPCVWIHAVSVGEVNLLGTTIDRIHERLPDCQIVVSTTTKTGFNLATRKYADLSVFYCPLDFSWAVDRAMRRVRPTLLVLAELELWPNLIAAAKLHGAKVAVINGRLSDNSFRGYGRVRPLVEGVLRQIDLIAAQNKETADRFRALGAANVHVTGSLKFDGAETDRRNAKTQALRQLAQFADDDIVWLAGSTQAPEEQMALDIYERVKRDCPRLRLVIVPRHPERFDEVADLLDRNGTPWIRRTELDTDRCGHRTSDSRLLLVDTIGELGAWWGTAEIAFVGGSFGDRGGQNMLEPAAYGAAVCFGPNTWNFRDIVSSLLAVNGAVVVEDAVALEAFVRRCLEDADYAKELGEDAQRLVASQLGATARTVDLLTPLIESSGNAQSRAA